MAHHGDNEGDKSEQSKCGIGFFFPTIGLEGFRMVIDVQKTLQQRDHENPPS